MELTVFLLLGVIVLVALLTRRVAARANHSPASVTDTDGAQKPQDPAE